MVVRPPEVSLANAPSHGGASDLGQLDDPHYSPDAMIPETTLLHEMMRASVSARISQIEQQMSALTVERDVLRQLLDTEQLQLLAERSHQAMRAAQPRELLEAALHEIFDAANGSLRWTDARAALVQRGIQAREQDVLDILQNSPSFKSSGQGWFRKVRHRTALRHRVVMGPPRAPDDDVGCNRIRGEVEQLT